MRAGNGAHTVYIIPRDRLLAAGGTLTLATAAGTHQLSVESEDEMLDGDVVLQDDEEDEEDEDQEILETEQVLEDEHCLENPPD